jgi:hypothetical protein
MVVNLFGISVTVPDDRNSVLWCFVFVTMEKLLTNIADKSYTKPLSKIYDSIWFIIDSYFSVHSVKTFREYFSV